MIEQFECYKIADYIVPALLLEKLNKVNWLTDSAIFRPTLSRGSRVIYFDCNFFREEIYAQGLSDDLIALKITGEDIVKDFIHTVVPDSICIKGEISGLRFGGQSPHQDHRVFHRIARRVHIPIVTCPTAKLCVGARKFHIPMNEVWAFDNVTELHYSENFSSSIRWHIIIDIVDTARLNYLLQYMTSEELSMLWREWLPKQPVSRLETLGLLAESKLAVLT